MGGFNLPPGVSVSDIPGNRPSDIEEEQFFDKLSEEMLKLGWRQPDIDDAFENDFTTKLISQARDIGYGAGFGEGRAEEQMAEAAKHEEEFEKQRCAVCGEELGDYSSRAEVVLKSTQFLSEVPHLIVHQDPCYNPETMEIA
jgi:hypothetical protein